MAERKPRIAVKPWDVERSLDALGLTLEQLHRSVRAGELERVSCTDLDPLSYPGTAAWALTIRNLRAELKPHGWKPQNKNNLPLTVHPDRTLGLLVTSGSLGTGDPDRKPTTKYPKGPMTADQIRVNNQYNLFDLLGAPSRFRPLPTRDEVLTYCLMIYTEFRPRDENVGTHVACCELSLPAAIDEDGFVCEWSNRIILPPVQLDDLPTRRRTDDEDEGEIDIPVARR